MADKKIKENDLENATGGANIPWDEIHLHCESCDYKETMAEDYYNSLENRDVCPKCGGHLDVTKTPTTLIRRIRNF